MIPNYTFSFAFDVDYGVEEAYMAVKHANTLKEAWDGIIADERKMRTEEDGLKTDQEIHEWFLESLSMGIIKPNILGENELFFNLYGEDKKGSPFQILKSFKYD